MLCYICDEIMNLFASCVLTTPCNFIATFYISALCDVLLGHITDAGLTRWFSILDKKTKSY